MSIVIDGNIAFASGSRTAVWFSTPAYSSFSNTQPGTKPKSTAVLPAKVLNELEVAYWGEDNLFPQNVEAQLRYCGVAKSALGFKARTLMGSGLVWGKVVDIDKNNNEIFEVAKPGAHRDVEEFMRENGHLHRYFTEFNIDWVYYANCFPELVTSKDRKKIKRLIHQESNDCRFRQMDENGEMKWVYISKLWGATKNQNVSFDPKKALAGISSITQRPKEVDNKWLYMRRAIDPYNAFEDFIEATEKEGHTNIIYPVSYPSPNKPYYQLAEWDGARMSGWLEIAAKMPTILKVLYESAFNIQYHVEVPESYFEAKYGIAEWQRKSPEDRQAAQTELVTQMDKYLSGEKNAYKTFVSFFSYDKIKGAETGRVKITPVEKKTNIDKELLASSAANSETLFAMQINPNLPGAGAPGGPYTQSSGSGSNIREAYLVYCAGLYTERKLILEPLELIQKVNGWDESLQFRIRDVVLTTLDQGKGTEKKLANAFKRYCHSPGIHRDSTGHRY